MLAETERVSASQLAQDFSDWLEESSASNVQHKPKAAKPGAFFTVGENEVSFDYGRAASLIHSGLSGAHLDSLVTLFGLPKKEALSAALKSNNTHVWRLAKGDKLIQGNTVEQILRTMQLQLLATTVFGRVEFARQWLQKAHPSLEGMSPADYADNEYAAQKVRGILAALRYGGVV